MTEYSDSPGPADSPAEYGTSPGTASGTDAGALAVEDRLPARQEPDPAADYDDLGYDYDEADYAAGYDGDLAALTAEDQLPPRQDASATEADDPQDDEASHEAGYDTGDGALAAEDRLPARQQPDADGGGDDPDYDYGEADPGDGYDGDFDALTADDQAPDTGDDHAPDRTTGDQDQPAGEVPPVPGEPGDLAAEVPGASAAAAPEQEDGNHAAPEESPAGALAETGSPAEADAGTQQGEAAQPADSHADPEADLKELKAEYEASLKDLKTELQALKDLWGPVSDAPEGTGREADQPRLDDHKLPVDQQNTRDVEQQDDRPGLWSNAKYALYGAVGTTVGMALLDQFAPGVSRVVDDIIVGVPTLVGALVPTLREGWKRKHDDSPDKR
ncbi:MAG: hypothetical protein ACRDOI_23190 [Trebonia sp.]